MTGRVRRKAGLAHSAALPASATATECALCRRPLGTRTEWHHVVPKSEGGTITVPLHAICHRAIHARASNAELARHHPTLDTLRLRADIARFLAWIAGKPADFHAPTRTRR